MPIHRSIRSILAAIGAALVIAPSALATPIQGPVGAGAESDRDGSVVVTRPAGFSWGDAAVGAGIALSLCAVVLAIVILFRHRTGMSHRGIGALAVAFVAAAGLAAPAIAVADSGQPTIQDESFQRSFIVGQCDGADILATFDITRRVITFLDGNGNPIRRIRIAAIPGALTNLQTGATLQTTGVRVIFDDFGTGTFTSTGTNVHIVVPGEGTLALGAGRLVLDAEGNVVLETGRQDAGLTEAVCAALSG
jgi:hypothetical protein